MSNNNKATLLELKTNNKSKYSDNCVAVKDKKTKNIHFLRPLLTIEQLVELLAISRVSFYRIKDDLIAHGLQCVRIGNSIRYTQESVEKMIQNLKMD